VSPRRLGGVRGQDGAIRGFLLVGVIVRVGVVLNLAEEFNFLNLGSLADALIEDVADGFTADLPPD
jgi:hypothetical protein